MITFEVTNQSIKLIEATPIGDIFVSGTVDEYKCKFVFNEAWEGYTKTAIFMPIVNSCSLINCCTGQPQTYDIILDENDECIIPYGALIDKQNLRVGVYGTTATTALPTVYSSLFMVRTGALPVNPVIAEDIGLYEQTLRKYAQIIEKVNHIEESAIPFGGEKGQILSKNSEADLDMIWADIPFPTWEDIQNKPIATESTVGLLKPNTNYGTTVTNTGEIKVVTCTDTDIDNRTEDSIYLSYRPITVKQLDYAVKAAMCDNKGAEWTAEEQTVAQSRIGILSSVGVKF